MFLLIPNFSIWSVISKLNLHSTMFLLIRSSNDDISDDYADLHSTMFLLIRYKPRGMGISLSIYIPQCFY